MYTKIFGVAVGALLSVATVASANGDDMTKTLSYDRVIVGDDKANIGVRARLSFAIWQMGRTILLQLHTSISSPCEPNFLSCSLQKMTGGLRTSEHSHT